MKVFKVLYRSTTGITTTTRLIVANSAVSAFKMAEDHRLNTETINKVEDISGELSVYVQDEKG